MIVDKMATHHMMSMELDDESMLDQVLPIPMEQRPSFPCELKISLTQRVLDMLKMDASDVEPGDMIHGHFMARATMCRSEDMEGGPNCCIELQIEDLEIESEDAEDDEN